MDIVDFFLGILGVLIVVAAAYLPRFTGKSDTIKWQHQKIGEYELRIKDQEATIAILKKELEEKDKLIDKQDQEYIDLCNERTSFPEFIQDLFTQAGENSDLEDLLEHAHTLYVELEEELEKKNKEIASWEKAWDAEDEEHAKIIEEIEKEHQEEIARLKEEIKYKDQRIWEFTQWHLKDVEYIRKLQAIVDPSGEKFRRYKN